MENEKQLTELESIAVIQRMIKTVNNDLEDDSFYFLLWGWLVFIASIGHFILMSLNYSNPSLVWLLMPLGGIISGIYGYRQNKNKKVKTYIDELMGYVLIAFLVSLFIVLFLMNKLGLNCYPLVMMVYGTWLFISGGASKFKPFIYGGIINWILCIIGFFVTFNIQLLLLAGAVLLGYIIPGHLLKSKYERSKNS